MSIADCRAAIGDAGTAGRRLVEEMAMLAILPRDRVARSAESGKRRGNDVAPSSAAGLFG
jgi:hypothetical protein